MSTQLDGVRQYMAQRAPAPPAGGAGSAAQVVMVGSGKGGVGTSTVAALLALLASAEGRDVLLVDAVDGMGAQHLLFGLRPERPLAALRGGEVTPRELLVPVSPTLTLLPGGDDVLADAPISAAERRALFRRVATLYAGYDLVVVDGGSRLESVLAAGGAGLGRLLAVTSTDRIALAATYALVKAVGMRLGEPSVEILVNRHDDAAALSAFGELRAAAEHFLTRALRFSGSLPEDECLRAGVSAGMPIHEAAVGSPAAAEMHLLAKRLLRELAPPRLANG